MSASSHTRGHRFAPELTHVVLNWLERHGRRVVNTSRALYLEISKVAQYRALEQAGIVVPRTIAAVGRDQVMTAAERLGEVPFILKPNRGGKGLGVQLVPSQDTLAAFLEDPGDAAPIDGVWLVQEYVRPEPPVITRCEFIGGRFFYAVEVDASQGFELCPADVCAVDDAFCPSGESPAVPNRFRILEGFKHPILERYAAFLAENGIEVAGIEFIPPPRRRGGDRRVPSPRSQSNVKRVVVAGQASRLASTNIISRRPRAQPCLRFAHRHPTCCRRGRSFSQMLDTRGVIWIWAVAALAISAVFGLMTVLTRDAPGSNGPTPDFAQPTRHFRVPNPARLSDADALSIYDRIRDDMVAAYRLSRDPVATQFSTWRRYNRVPYLSATHGQRYINNYANGKAESYGQEDAGPMPAGAVLAKDSFTVTARGDVFTGPLFLMEKMAPGFSAETRDWRYTMIMPDGSLFGTTKGESSERVEFCVTCHATAGDAADHLFFVPERYRMRFLLLEQEYQRWP